MSVVKYQIPLLLSSDTTTGAVNVSSDGSTFEVIFDEPISVPVAPF